MKRIVVLISGSGSNLQAIIENIKQGYIKAEIVEVISNNENAYGLIRAKNENINTFVLNHKSFNSRDEFDIALDKRIEVNNPDLIVMAGFMRILTPLIPSKFKGKIINIHPSLLPLYPGLDTHEKVISNHDKEHGISIHFVSAILDGGPLIAQGIIDTNNNSIELLTKRIHSVEHLLYPLVINYICEEKIYLEHSTDKVIFNDVKLIDGLLKIKYDV
jgi:phosphoribosylglycinamide formyltransferase-1